MRTYISHQLARHLANVYSYYKAKTGRLMLVWRHGQLYWLGYVTPHGFYLVSFDHAKGQSQSHHEMAS